MVKGRSGKRKKWFDFASDQGPYSRKVLAKS